MISFKQFLNEARIAPLYHGTDIVQLVEILERGIQPYTEHDLSQLQGKLEKHPRYSDETVSGISLTRDKRFALKYPNIKYGSAKVGFGSSPERAIAIEFNQNKLTQSYKVRPINYWADIDSRAGRPESEEFIITNKPITLRFFTAIWINKNAWETDRYISKQTRKHISDIARLFKIKIKLV